MICDIHTCIFYLSVFYHCSFRDESDNSFEGDVMLLMAGVGVIICYVAIILGKFNEVEHKVRLIEMYLVDLMLDIIYTYTYIYMVSDIWYNNVTYQV